MDVDSKRNKIWAKSISPHFCSKFVSRDRTEGRRPIGSQGHCFIRSVPPLSNFVVCTFQQTIEATTANGLM